MWIAVSRRKIHTNCNHSFVHSVFIPLIPTLTTPPTHPPTPYTHTHTHTHTHDSQDDFIHVEWVDDYYTEYGRNRFPQTSVFKLAFPFITTQVRIRKFTEVYGYILCPCSVVFIQWFTGPVYKKSMLKIVKTIRT